ncbi:hypothetical protein J5277_08885 [Rhizobium sp. 16-449-1b]|nr:hypothetical protein [Rhizobium sp. 16-449-1b]MBO9194218.1 hypothetical protein [Rhizobium sp. 16-449-1b]
MQHSTLGASILSAAHKLETGALWDAKKASLRTNFDAFQTAKQSLK